MSTQAKIEHGKTKITVDVTGCVTCGTLWSSGWLQIQELNLTVGLHHDTILIFKCADCVKRDGGQLTM